MHPYEKIRREVAIMKFVKENTTIPVPRVIAFGIAAENHDPAIGPFLITDWVEGKPVTAFLEKLPRPSWGPVLREDIEEHQLRTIYSQMASILLELAEHDFNKIGALFTDQSYPKMSSWSIKLRPMTLRVNDIEAGGNVVVDSKALCLHV
jgi:aminoglycoside phosphotransferase (APT) family kinase protein